MRSTLKNMVLDLKLMILAATRHWKCRVCGCRVKKWTQYCDACADHMKGLLCETESP